MRRLLLATLLTIASVTTLTNAQSPAPPQAATIDHADAIALLDRIQRVLDQATSVTDRQVTLDRGVVDELRAEVTQVKVMLQSEQVR